MKQLLKKLIPHKLKHYLLNKKGVIKWFFLGKPTPPPYIIKRMIIKKLSKKYKTKILIETGTYHGDTIDYLKNNFEKIYSIELDHDLWHKAQVRFKPFKHINLLQGDSGQVLNEILPAINQKTIFWLDGHYSAGITAKGDLNTPIIKELEHILEHKIKNHIILIDDARCFTGENDYPTLETLSQFIKRRNPDLTFEVKNDIIIII